MLGIIQEQHPDRCRLFMQWKQMDWPVIVDSFNLLGVSAVPITLLIDEAGVIRAINPKKACLTEFLEEPSATEAPLQMKDSSSAQREPSESNQLSEDRDSSIVPNCQVPSQCLELDAFIERSRAKVSDRPHDGPAHFRLGVALRKRYDSDSRREGDFQAAVNHWEKALEIDPNQYIWRRRIQQYGPRLSKPYPFYDWVEQARKEITERGEVPYPLVVEPSGAEFAAPSKEFDTSSASPENPDPENRILRDQEGFIQIEAAAAPQTVSAGEAARIHLSFRPNQAIDAHWNNEAEDMLIWVRAPEGWIINERLISLPRPREAISTETRQAEFEVRAPTDFSGSAKVTLYALYYVCEGVNGTCLYRRQDASVRLTAR